MSMETKKLGFILEIKEHMKDVEENPTKKKLAKVADRLAVFNSTYGYLKKELEASGNSEFELITMCEKIDNVVNSL